MLGEINRVPGRRFFYMRNVVAVNHFVAVAIVHGVFKIGVEVDFFEFTLEVEFKDLGFEVIVDIDDVIIVGDFLYGILGGQFVVGAFVEFARHFEQGNVRFLGKFLFLEVKSLARPEQLRHKDADDGDKTKQNNAIEFVDFHGC